MTPLLLDPIAARIGGIWYAKDGREEYGSNEVAHTVEDLVMRGNKRKKKSGLE